MCCFHLNFLNKEFLLIRLLTLIIYSEVLEAFGQNDTLFLQLGVLQDDIR